MFKKISDFFKKIDEKLKDFLFKNRYGTIMVIVGIIVAFWDLTLKFLLDDKNMPAINGVFSIYSTHNTGGAWSIFSGSIVFLIIVTIIFIGAIIFLNYKLKIKNYFYAISMGLLLSGALCNLYDRIALGYVRDFINLEFIKFPIFNIADIAITFGVILLCIYFLFIMPKLQKRKLALSSDKASAVDENVSDKNEQLEVDLKESDVSKEETEKQEQLEAELKDGDTRNETTEKQELTEKSKTKSKSKREKNAK